MHNRWSVLALLFAVRMAMAFQFQSVAALSLMLRRDLGLDLADLGLLIGLYLAPGVALALPGGAIGKRIGDRTTVIAGLLLMISGGLLMVASQRWEALLAGRLLAGVGGVLLNVLMSKMVVDWFAGREIATAMAVFVNSWPVGIAAALLILPFVIDGGLSIAFAAAVAPAILGVIAFALLYRDAPVSATPAGAAGAWPGGANLAGLVICGFIWGLYNAAVSMVFSFGPSMLGERGWAPALAGATVSMTLWLIGLSVPMGGVIADRLRSADHTLLIGLLAFAAALAAAAHMEAAGPAFVVLGLCCGIAAGPIMSLPARVLAPETRAIGMGIFYTVFYVCLMSGPWLAGFLARSIGDSRATFDAGVAMLAACVLLFAAFLRLAPSTAAKRI